MICLSLAHIRLLSPCRPPTPLSGLQRVCGEVPSLVRVHPFWEPLTIWLQNSFWENLMVREKSISHKTKSLKLIQSYDVTHYYGEADA